MYQRIKNCKYVCYSFLHVVDHSVKKLRQRVKQIAAQENYVLSKKGRVQLLNLY